MLRAFAVSFLVYTFPLVCVAVSGEGSGSGYQPPGFGALRLVGGIDEREGRVEVYIDEEWGTVCGDLWDDTQTMVVCRQLNFYQEGQMVLTITHNPEFFEGESEGPVHMDTVFCKGDEPMLVNCTNTSPGHCPHLKDIGVVCPGNCTFGDVRLMGGKDDNEGRVEVCMRGLWGTICDNHWGVFEATVVCKQLGIEGSKRAIGVGAAYFGGGRDPILMDSVSCGGTEGNLTQCKHKTEHNCQHSEDVGVLCNGGREECTNNDVRLVGGRDKREGVVQVCYEGVWGAICDDYDVPEDYGPERLHIVLDNAAEVICRQLGYLRPNTSAVIVRGYPLTGVEVPLLLQHSGLECSGSELQLIQCVGYVVGEHSCSEPNGVLVVCPENCTEGEARLVGGRHSREGRVEVCLLGHWIGVCNERWSDREAEVLCRQLDYAKPDSISVAIDGYHFGRPQRSPLFHVTCSSTEPILYACHSEIDQCDPIDSAGVICEVNCEDEQTRMLLEDNDADNVCHDTSMGQSPSSSSEMGIVLAGTLTPLMLTIVLLVAILVFLLLKLRAISSKQVLSSSKPATPLQNSCNTSKTDMDPPMLVSQSSREQFQQSSQSTASNHVTLMDLKPEASLPHLYESLKGGQKLWLSSPRGSELDILEEEERGAAAAGCNDPTFNSIGNTHAYAILEPEESVWCEFATTADSLPSLLAPSSLDHEYSADESAVSSAAAVLNFETNPLPLPPRHEATKGSESAKSKKSVQKEDSAPYETSMYDSLIPMATGSKPKHSGTSTHEDRLTFSLKPVTGHAQASQRKRLYSE